MKISTIAFIPQGVVRSGDKVRVICLPKAKKKAEYRLERFHFRNLKRNLDTNSQLVNLRIGSKFFTKSNYKKNKISKKSNVDLLIARDRKFYAEMQFSWILS